MIFGGQELVKTQELDDYQRSIINYQWRSTRSPRWSMISPSSVIIIRSFWAFFLAIDGGGKKEKSRASSDTIVRLRNIAVAPRWPIIIQHLSIDCVSVSLVLGYCLLWSHNYNFIDDWLLGEPASQSAQDHQDDEKVLLWFSKIIYKLFARP